MDATVDEKVATIHARHTVLVAIISGIVGVVTTLITINSQSVQAVIPAVIRVSGNNTQDVQLQSTVTTLRGQVAELQKALAQTNANRADAVNGGSVVQEQGGLAQQKPVSVLTPTTAPYIRLQLWKLPRTKQSCLKAASQAMWNSGFSNLTSDRSSVLGQREQYKASIACYASSHEAVLAAIGPDRTQTGAALDRLLLEFADLFKGH